MKTGDVPDGLVVLPGCSSLFGTDLPVRCRGGGVILLGRDDLKCWRRNDLQQESFWVKLEVEAGKSVVLGCVC